MTNSPPDHNTPRHQCARFVDEAGNAASVEQLTKSQFDALCKAGEFKEGPFKDSFGDGPGEPYYPWRQVFGRLKDGRVVWAELTESEPA